MNRRKASFRLNEKTISKLKKMSDSRKRSSQESSQGKIIDDLVSSSGISSNRTMHLSVAADRRLKQLERSHGMTRDRIVEFLITNCNLELQIAVQ